MTDRVGYGAGPVAVGDWIRVRSEMTPPEGEWHEVIGIFGVSLTGEYIYEVPAEEGIDSATWGHLSVMEVAPAPNGLGPRDE